MQNRCPYCGGFMSTFTDNYLLGTRSNGRKVYAPGTMAYCKQCNYRTELSIGALPWAREQAEAGELELVARWGTNA